MYNLPELAKTAEDRFLNWSYDQKIPALLTALAAHKELPKPIEVQAEKLNYLLVKAEVYCRYREALSHLTQSESVYRVFNGQDGNAQSNLALTSLMPDPALSDKAGDVAVHFANQMARMEKEFTEANVDYCAILRFLRHGT
ncbi:MAG: hypothetical protein RL095_2721 [Verrucomicrobiota bacterium]|jgi:hypothetical protein